jgi:galactokinase
MSSSAGNQPETALFDQQVIAAVTAHDFFAPEKPIWVARAPGRLDVMGGNVDYTGGMVLQSLLREATWAAVQPRPDTVIRILNPGATRWGWQSYIEVDSEALGSLQSVRQVAEQNDTLRWICYVLGSLYFLKKHHSWRHNGADVFIASDLPINRGVSSSAALEIAVLKAASAAYTIPLDGVALATAGQWTENVVVGAACGIMDQAAIVMGQKDRLLPMLCQPCQPFPSIVMPNGFRFWGIDSMAPRSTSSAAYETARAAAFIGYQLICQREHIQVVPDEDSDILRWTDFRWKGYLSNLPPSEFHAKYERWLPETLGGSEFLAHAGEHVDPFTKIDVNTEYPVRAAVRYAVEENLRVQTVLALLASTTPGTLENRLELIGEILCRSHVAYAQCGLGSGACDELVSLALQAGFPGAKMTGGGGGGVVAVLGRSGDDDAVRQLAQEYGAGRGMTPRIFEGSSDGTDAFEVRVLQLPS